MNFLDKFKPDRKSSVRQLIGIDSIEDYCVACSSGSKTAYLFVTPVNLNVLSKSVIETKVECLAKAVIDLATTELICINSAQNYESNKRFLNQRILNEQNDTVREIDRQDVDFLDEIQVKMATSRAFLIRLVFLAKDNLQQITYTLEKSRQIMVANDFIVQIADRASIKRMLAIYFEQNIYDEEMQDYDGERYAPILEMKK